MTAALVLSTLALPAPAIAAPEDPQIAAELPADGAVLPTNPDGIEVRYTCPEPYRSVGESPFITFGDRSDFAALHRQRLSLARLLLRDIHRGRHVCRRSPGEEVPHSVHFGTKKVAVGAMSTLP